MSSVKLTGFSGIPAATAAPLNAIRDSTRRVCKPHRMRTELRSLAATHGSSTKIFGISVIKPAHEPHAVFMVIVNPLCASLPILAISFRALREEGLMNCAIVWRRGFVRSRTK